MKNLNYQTGKLGEDIAQKHLASKGFEIIDTNFRTRFGEIDIIASYKNQLVFVEVKLKVGDQFGHPEEMISPKKIWQIRQMAEVYLQSHSEIAGKYPQLRIDAVCIVADKSLNPLRITHYESIE